MRRTPGIDQDQLAIEDGRFRGQRAEGRAHAGQALCIVGTVARVEADTSAVLDDLEPEAIPFGLMQPIIALGRANGCRRG